MTSQPHLVDGIDDPRIASIEPRSMLEHRDGIWWVLVVDRMRRTRRPTEVEKLLELLGERRTQLGGLRLTGAQEQASGARGMVSTWLGWSGLSHFTHLDLSECRIGKDGLKQLLGCGHVARLEHLGLAGCDIGRQGVTMLKQSDDMPALRSLDLSASENDRTKWNDSMLKHLVSLTKKKPHGATLQGLEALKLGRWDCHFSLKGLADSSLGRGLRVLDLDGQMSLCYGVLQLLHGLARSGGRLEELRLRWVFRNYSVEDWNEPLVPLETLRRLVFDDGSFRAVHVAALPKAWFWPQLESLSLARCNLYPGTLDPWADAPVGPRRLCLDGNEHLGREALHAFAAYPMAAALEQLSLQKTARPEDLEGLPDPILGAIEAAGGLD